MAEPKQSSSDPTTPLEFHLSRNARERCSFDRDLLKDDGGIRTPDALTVQELAARMNARLAPEGKGAKPGHLYALVLLQHILHVVVDRYRRERERDVFEKAEQWLSERPPEPKVAESVQRFGAFYTPIPVFRGERELREFLEQRLGEIPGRHALIEQMMLVYLANANPAAQTTRPLYDDRDLPARDDYLRRIAELEKFFAQMPKFGPKGQSLFELLAAPMKNSPDSLRGQLEFIRRQWAELLTPELLHALLVAEDVVREEEKGAWTPGGTFAPDADYLRRLASRAMFEGAYGEAERFSADTDWMPRVVLLAKSVYVWLDQLSRRYGRRIRRLDEIPDEELDRLAGWGFTGLWLIGLWERSEASRKIKNLRGNLDAVASAYSLWDYRVSGDLGGDDALANLRDRALQRGIRLASDLVPNHMGLDSRWTREHPGWFIQSEHPPYGAYRFTGPDLSGDPSFQLRIEDGYWSERDAAVVFQRVDNRTGEVRYMYHGNDGTSMPWNDTAQLDFLQGDVREAVIQLILHVARMTPILRFDAAMTLTKKHYQRLWFPEPGTGGAIPSRAIAGLSRADFDQRMPNEFWREVVDRVAAEAPDTLLLAEAFWLLEGYFVRTLGMHRVYNSAFMNMLKLEENAKYRSVLKNVLEFDPRVLQRFVNFMNNPDEETAVAQFGKGDKYIGVCLMMATMPGLPMFGHGQVEGLTEKYGHEYQRAYYDEQPDEDLVRRHEREIFPLLRQRHLFSGADHFLLYDVQRDAGGTDENVFAFSNGAGAARALIVYHNKWAETSGSIQTSAAFSISDGNARTLVRRTLADGLGLRGDDGLFYVLKDRATGLEYLRRGSDLCARGLHVSLRAYQYQVFTEFREIRDDAERRWSRLCESLGGRGVPSLDHEFKRVHFGPLIAAFRAFASADHLRALIEETAPPSPHAGARASDAAGAAAEFAARSRAFLEQAKHFGQGNRAVAGAQADVQAAAYALLHLPVSARWIAWGRTRESVQARQRLLRAVPARRALSEPFWRILGGWLTLWAEARLHMKDGDRIAADALDDWLLADALSDTLRACGAGEAQVWCEVELVRALTKHRRLAATFSAPPRYREAIAMLNDGAAQRVIGGNEYGGVVWYHRESFDTLLNTLFVMRIVSLLLNAKLTRAERGRQAAEAHRHFTLIEDLSAIAGYRLETLKTLLGYFE
ncbi:MAG: alpha-amylase family glycosyl hydrolase [bacterium]|nr:alpha-amylase family glycosyl hydrolase [bacterium]